MSVCMIDEVTRTIINSGEAGAGIGKVVRAINAGTPHPRQRLASANNQDLNNLTSFGLQYSIVLYYEHF